MLSTKRKLALHIKNLLGWTTRRKLVAISVDDYGNIRQDSKKSVNALQDAGLKIINRFDLLDGLETSDDLHALFEVLSSHKDMNGKHPVVTAFTVAQNIDFDAIRASNFESVYYENIDQSILKHSGANTWNIWKEGISKKLIWPEYHGRTHFHEGILAQRLKTKDHEALQCITHNSYTGFSYPNNGECSYLSTYSYNDQDEFTDLINHAQEGINAFKEVFKRSPIHFTSPGKLTHSKIEAALAPFGIKYIDTLTKKKEYQGNGKFVTKWNYLGKKNKANQKYIIRNCVFEPLINYGVEKCLQEIEIAFRMKKPANISSHRLNFCGRIEEKNRSNGLKAFNSLLKQIVTRWPDVEFVTTPHLGKLMTE